MKQFLHHESVKSSKYVLKSFLGAIAFYTYIPLPSQWKLEWQRIARFAPLIGMMIGGFLGLIDLGLKQLAMPELTRSALIVGIWILLTGGLHLDGAIDSADGLAVLEPKERLEAMQDSRTGAFGAMAAVIVILLKTAALSEITNYRWLALMACAGWGRWGQVWAIAYYDYLKPEGKGAFHKESIQLPQDLLLGLIALIGLSATQLYFHPQVWQPPLVIILGGALTTIAVAAWFKRQLGGHTGDSYGAVVEWTEALLMCLLTMVF